MKNCNRHLMLYLKINCFFFLCLLLFYPIHKRILKTCFSQFYLALKEFSLIFSLIPFIAPIVIFSFSHIQKFLFLRTLLLYEFLAMLCLINKKETKLLHLINCYLHADFFCFLFSNSILISNFLINYVFIYKCIGVT